MLLLKIQKRSPTESTVPTKPIFYAVLIADASTEARGIIRKQPIEFLVLGDLSLLASFSILTSVGISF